MQRVRYIFHIVLHSVRHCLNASSLFDRHRRRMGVPLVRQSVAVNQPGEQVATLADSGLVISDALDELLTSSWG